MAHTLASEADLPRSPKRSDGHDRRRRARARRGTGTGTAGGRKSGVAAPERGRIARDVRAGEGARHQKKSAGTNQATPPPSRRGCPARQAPLGTPTDPTAAAGSRAAPACGPPPPPPPYFWGPAPRPAFRSSTDTPECRGRTDTRRLPRPRRRRRAKRRSASRCPWPSSLRRPRPPAWRTPSAA